MELGFENFLNIKILEKFAEIGDCTDEIYKLFKMIDDNINSLYLMEICAKYKCDDLLLFMSSMIISKNIFDIALKSGNEKFVLWGLTSRKYVPDIKSLKSIITNKSFTCKLQLVHKLIKYSK